MLQLISTPGEGQQQDVRQTIVDYTNQKHTTINHTTINHQIKGASLHLGFPTYDHLFLFAQRSTSEE